MVISGELVREHVPRERLLMNAVRRIPRQFGWGHNRPLLSTYLISSARSDSTTGSSQLFGQDLLARLNQLLDLPLFEMLSQEMSACGDHRKLMVFEYLEPIAGVFAYKNGIAMDEGSVWVCLNCSCVANHKC
jgi:hypothetical protein